MAEESLGQRAGRAAIWQVAGGGWQTIVRLGASIYLARALKPSDFGLFGMALLYQQLLVTALSLGFGTGLIVKKDLTEEDLSTSFWLSCAVRVTVFLAVFLTAPLAAMFWKEPRVEPVIRVISFTLLISLIGAIPGTLATKNLEFKKINIIRGIAILLESSTAVALVALTNLTYWALVIGMMVNAVFYNLTLWLATGAWRPRLTFHKDAFRYLFRFGFYTWLFSITNYLKQNVDYFLVGRLLGTYKLGLYEFAYRLPHLVFDRISRPVGDVVFPALSKVQDDNEALFRGYVTAVKYVCLVCWPMLFGLIAVADILVPTLWGDQWLPIITPLRILCVCAALRCLIQPAGGLFNCKNRPDLSFKISFVTLMLLVPLVLIFGYYYNLTGIALAMLISVFFLVAVIFYIISSLLNISLRPFFSEIYPVFTSSFILLIITFFTKIFFSKIYFDSFLVIFISCFLGALAYIFLLHFIFSSFTTTIKNKIFLILSKGF
ncbi:lipopolysaccharide biosynthesis protein [Thermodesulfatator atlanticus]|uniref:lipopolysaccharide biosynthesis protein n=1 Tax=Thermodesulfatator atlanticus TaxID=501497 RepID=UPI0012F8C1A2|nr:lipopolysaccharide biosynthesis protein [Thermodesulfatator atlanticus]